MRTKHIVLLSPRPRHRSVFLGASPLFQADALEVPAVPQPVVEVDELNESDVARLSRDTDVVAVAPAMPVSLIQPIDLPASTVAATNGIVWGVKTLGADSSPYTGRGVVVAVLDTGIDPAHAAFTGVKLIRKNFTTEGEDDLQGHGTHCAGTIFGRAVEGTRIGVAPGVETALIGKVLGQNGGSSDQIASAVQWAVENGANVISMSLGMDFPGYAERLAESGMPRPVATSKALEGYRANLLLFERLAGLIRAQAAFGKVCMLVAAAGNESRRDLNPGYVIAACPPSVADGVISVSALTQEAAGLDVAYFSNIGALLAAPGGNIISAKRGGGLTPKSGTSMATPHVAGAAALWAEKIRAKGALSHQEWTSRLLGSATSFGLKPGLTSLEVGGGLIQAPRA